MVIAYANDTSFRYECLRDRIDYAAEKCQGLKGNDLENLVVSQVLRVLEPAQVELSLKAADQLQKEQARLLKHWKQRLERAQYEVDRSSRQYHAVEPENRLVARELERRWNEALSEQRKLQEEFERFEKDHALILKEADNMRPQFFDFLFRVPRRLVDSSICSSPN